MSETWYRYLNRKGTKNLMDNEKIDYDCNIVICRQSFSGREFRVFQNYVEFYKYFKKNNIAEVIMPISNRQRTFGGSDDSAYRYDEEIEDGKYCFYEVLLEKSKRKLFFELEFYTNEVSWEECSIYVNIKKHLCYDKVIPDLIDCLKILISDPKFCFYTFSSPKMLTIHLVVANYYLNSYAECITFFQKLKELIDDNHHSYFNEYAYKKIQQIRIYNSSLISKSKNIKKNIKFTEFFDMRYIPESYENFLNSLVGAYFTNSKYLENKLSINESCISPKINIPKKLLKDIIAFGEPPHVDSKLIRVNEVGGNLILTFSSKTYFCHRCAMKHFNSFYKLELINKIKIFITCSRSSDRYFSNKLPKFANEYSGEI